MKDSNPRLEHDRLRKIVQRIVIWEPIEKRVTGIWFGAKFEA